MSVLGGNQPETRRMSPASFAVSLALHALVLCALLYRPEPKLLQPHSSLRGDGGSGRSAIRLVAPGYSGIESPVTAKARSDNKTYLTRKPKSHPTPEAQAATANKPLKPGMPGFILGSLASGLADDHDVRVALPVVAPDPPITRAKLPDWLRGDVIVEVTIDEHGQVVKTVVLASVGFGLEDTIVDTLKQWRFSPATIDGIAVASRQDVYFHFPS